jgi:hypothetical protein
MIGEKIYCARKECGMGFVKTTHNMKYCSNECCRIETNRKIMEKYHETRARQKGAKRNCLSCDTRLSRYNPSKFCGACETAKREQHHGEAAELVSSVSWL